MVNGSDTDVARSGFYDAGAGYNNKAAAFNLGFLAQGGTPLDGAQTTAGNNALQSAIGDAKTGGAKFLKHLAATDNGLSTQCSEQVLSFKVDASKWNKIKNIEVDIDDEDLGGVDVLNVSGFVDARIQLGDVDEQGGNPNGGMDLNGAGLGPITVNVTDAKRGELEATDADYAVHYNLALASNGSGWQNSFDLRGSASDDKFVITASDTEKLGRWDNKNHADGKNGALTKIVADMGDGDDLFDSGTVGTRDIVSMGNGVNHVRTGDGNDIINIDLTHRGGIAPGNVGFETIVCDFDMNDQDRNGGKGENDFDTFVFEN